MIFLASYVRVSLYVSEHPLSCICGSPLCLYVGCRPQELQKQRSAQPYNSISNPIYEITIYQTSALCCCAPVVTLLSSDHQTLLHIRADFGRVKLLALANGRSAWSESIQSLGDIHTHSAIHDCCRYDGWLLQ